MGKRRRMKEIPWYADIHRGESSFVIVCRSERKREDEGEVYRKMAEAGDEEKKK